MRPERQWLPPATESLDPAARERAIDIAQREGLHPIVVQVLLQRGLADDELGSYLNPQVANLHDPLALRGMDAGVRVMDEAIRSGRKITIYGDYDVDGTTATAALISYLRHAGADVDYFIPMRLAGYGITTDALDNIWADQKPELLISVDCGVKSRAEVEYAKRLGMSVIVTDHHLPAPGKTPLGIVINPHLEEDEYPFKDIAGVAVAYKLIAAHYGSQPVGNLDLVAMGTVSDVMPLLDENRAIVAYGLQKLAQTKRPGLAALIDTVGLKGERRQQLTSSDLGYRIGPRINAVGRMGLDPNLVVELLTTTDPERGRELAIMLDNANKQRQQQTDGLVKQAMTMVDPSDRFIVLEMDLFAGVAGIVAGRVVEEYNRPAIVLDRNGHGSGRSIDGVPLITLEGTGVLDEFAGELWVGGGHSYACGVKQLPRGVEELRRALNASTRIPAELAAPIRQIDALCKLSDVNENLLASLRRLEPTGKENESVTLMVSNVEVVSERRMGTDQQHYACVVRDDSLAASETRRAVFFRAGDLPSQLGQYVDIAFSPEWDDYAGGVQLMVKDLRTTA